MIDRTDDLSYHRRRADQEQGLAQTAADPMVRRVHEQLAQYQRERVDTPAVLRVVQPD